MPRDWSATVGYDRGSGLGFAGGYVGTGVTATNLAGRTLADLVRLPWVDLYAAYRLADRRELAVRTATSPIGRLADRVAGR